MNPHLKGVAAEQQQINDAIYKANAPVRAAQAVANLKAKQEAANYNPNLVTGADGYRTIFDGKGNVVGTTAPVKSKLGYAGETPEMAKAAFNRGEGTNAERASLRAGMQQAGMKSVASKPTGVDQIFGQNKQVSPSGGIAGDMVGPQQPQGAPGGDLFGQVPEFRSSGMPVQSVNDTPGAWAAMARQKAFPSDKMTKPLTPPASPVQMEVLKRLFRLFGTQSPASAGLESIFTDIIPGKPDWATLQQLFPGVVQPGVGSAQNMRALQSLYLNPVHQIFF